MTHRSNARLAGFAFLAYIATGITSMILMGQATAGGDAAARFHSIVQHTTTLRLSALLAFVGFFEAIILGVTLYALTRDEDRDLASLALCCRVGEGVLGASAALGTLQVLTVATVITTDPSATSLATGFSAMLLEDGGASAVIAGTCFAVGSALFSYLFLRARSIPVALAWLGVVASVLLVIALPVRLLGFLPRSLDWLIWMPMLAFEVTLAFWLIVKGVAVVNPARE